MKLGLPWRRARLEAPDPEPAAAHAPASSPVLNLLTQETLWGGAEIRDADPPITVLEDVFHVPDRPGGDWGLFHRDGSPVRSALDYLGPENAPMRPEPVSPVGYDEVATALPPGDYLYGGGIYPHFGHFIVDTLPRLWPLARERRPGQKVLFDGPGGPDEWWSRPWVADMLSGLGLHRDDLVECREPVRIERLVMPQRSLQGQAFGHPAFQRMTRLIGTSLLDAAPPAAGGPVYLSKTRLTGGVQRVVNELQLERFLAVRGVEIVYPEALSFREQLSLFASSRTITGITTSAMHVGVFAPPARVRALHPSDLLNSNFLILDRLNGADAAYFHPRGSREVSRNANGFMVEHVFMDPIAIGRALLELL